jgi:hypothetical protein
MEFWTDPDEQKFILDWIEKNNPKSILEYGSGHSTTVLQNKAEHLTSVEHTAKWYNKIKSKLNDNVEYLFVPPDNMLWEDQFDGSGRKTPAGDDGDFMDFASYVTAPLLSLNKPFDLMYIDGRARVACASLAKALLRDSNSRVLIHDFGPEAYHPHLSHRTYYDVVMGWLEPVERVKQIGLFKVREQ